MEVRLRTVFYKTDSEIINARLTSPQSSIGFIYYSTAKEGAL